MRQGYLALVLHAHLPFIRHPPGDGALEQQWLFQAMTESYIPLLRVLEGLAQDGIDFQLTLGLSPTLVAMLRDPFLQQRYEAYLTRSIELAARESRHGDRDAHRRSLAAHYAREFRCIRATWESHNRDLVAAFRQLAAADYLDIITCAATHGYLPLLRAHPEAVRAQIAVACQHHWQHFGQRPSGIWLPECGYYEGLERVLAQAGLRYFITEAHGLRHARPQPPAGIAAPVLTPAGIAAFGRDPQAAAQVWSAQEGYPGDPAYREFYKDWGWEAPERDIAPYLLPDGSRQPLGLKYHRITGRGVDLGAKARYDPDRAQARAAEHARHFVGQRARQLRQWHCSSPHPPLVVAPYDAELFGHWWYEGPQFLDGVLRACHRHAGGCRPIHLHDYLRAHPTHPVAQPAQSSWGERGFHARWLDGSNAWLHRHLHAAAERAITLAQHEPADELAQRAHNQAARELLLAQASDWAFILRAGTVTTYAERRARSHLQRFHKLARDLQTERVEKDWLAHLEALDNLFPQLDYRIYR
ncbi:MAG: DUF1957 domain-containing protein [Cyanobacteria bacterium QS_8_64_29]|nr:MAG: DUF1957 domain-containing protein [Cyanobacteria bacterium QS_8_64_29]